MDRKESVGYVGGGGEEDEVGVGCGRIGLIIIMVLWRTRLVGLLVAPF